MQKESTPQSTKPESGHAMTNGAYRAEGPQTVCKFEIVCQLPCKHVQIGYYDS